MEEVVDEIELDELSSDLEAGDLHHGRPPFEPEAVAIELAEVPLQEAPSAEVEFEADHLDVVLLVRLSGGHRIEGADGRTRSTRLTVRVAKLTQG